MATRYSARGSFGSTFAELTKTLAPKFAVQFWSGAWQNVLVDAADVETIIRYMYALDDYLGGDRDALRPFAGRSVLDYASGKRIRLVPNTGELKKLFSLEPATSSKPPKTRGLQRKIKKAAPKLTPSTKLRKSRTLLRKLEKLAASVSRSRPKTVGEKSAKTKLLARIEKAQRSAQRTKRAASKAAAKRNASKPPTKRAVSKSPTQKPAVVKRKSRSIPPGLKALQMWSGTWRDVLVNEADASTIGRYMNAIAAYLSGDRGAMRPFAGRSILDYASGERIKLVTASRDLVMSADTLRDIHTHSIYRDRTDVDRAFRGAA